MSVMIVDWWEGCSSCCWNQKRAKVPTGNMWCRAAAGSEKRKPADWETFGDTPLSLGELWTSTGHGLGQGFQGDFTLVSRHRVASEFWVI